MKFVFLFLIAYYSISFASAQINCNKIPFYPVNYIRNSSLEQDSASCSLIISATNNTSLLSTIPYWQYPVYPNPMSVFYFGECNSFITATRYEVYPVVPQPIPDGKGVLGLYDGSSNSSSVNSDTFKQKGTIATILTHPLKKDSLYRLNFYLGFGTRKACARCFDRSPSPATISIYGLADSSSLPFQNPFNRANYGCLTNTNKAWINLGTHIIDGGNLGKWVKDSISFVAPDNIQVLAIGPGCNSQNNVIENDGSLGNYMLFLDNLQLYQASVPMAVIEKTSGSFCDIPNASVTLQLKSASFFSGSKFQWYKNNLPVTETTSTINITKNGYGEGWYQCGIQNDSVCVRSDSFHVFWDPLPASVIGKNKDTVSCIGDTVLLNINGGANATYLWDDSTVVSTRKVMKSGTYTVKISNACSTVTASKKIDFKDCPSLFYLPSAFTPNNDGLNDVFKPYCKCVIKKYSLSIYNRWGSKIFYSEEFSKGWDGTIKRVPQNQGTFVWVANYADGNGVEHNEKGTVTLIK